MSQAQPDGFLAVPVNGIGSAVLVLHAWWGLNDTMRAFCTRLAESGFVAFAPDLYHGKVADTIADAEALMMALDDVQSNAEIDKAARFLVEHDSQAGGGVAVIGFSLGANYALDLTSVQSSSSMVQGEATGAAQEQPIWAIFPKRIRSSRSPVSPNWRNP